jgi:hypothetical protein
MYDDRAELERVDALWTAVQPPWGHWIRRGYRYMATPDATYPLVLGCIDCEMQRWETEYMPRIKAAWLTVKFADKPRILNSRRIWRDQDRKVPNEDHPRVRKALERMPEVRPAMLLSVGKWRYEDDGRRHRRWSVGQAEGLVGRLEQDLVRNGRHL